ncbi:TIGR03620 family F420-dependent LLM class oxidoreductase [Actinomadura decatromicini]|uniref:TIGR03620 family F420-dependent LLM class oxidoreductase n=1 Tax=Actinomadura decatromicini TaxID=2604572 RepID=A0A5D3FST3_9ACTN|nr:TIGR03620 family F420-dependent LLM class oxidoreductase [Actinomadura decatromicini]TYK51421.1 TIGR03620 family F420-dependent LLM class oxidoreductase [Actinomadura decatromicini]
MDTTAGPLGLWTLALDKEPAARVREVAAEIESLGFGALWIGEEFGRNVLTHAGLLLGATDGLVVGTGIANIFFRDPIAMAAAERSLAEAYPGRFVLGLGGHRVDDRPLIYLGHRVPSGGRAVSTMGAYLDAMDAVPLQSPPPPAPSRRVLGALGPKMLNLAAEKTDGALPYLVPVAHTEDARARLGPDALLAVEQAVVLDPDPARARELARAHVARYFALGGAHVKDMLRFGYAIEELSDAPADRVVDALVAGGGPGALDAVSDRVRAHLDAGADHVCLQVLTARPGAPIAEWRELAGLTGDLPPRARAVSRAGSAT